jgi:hypothetical protein
VQVTGGTLGGNGSIGGAVTIGGGSGSAALTPGVHPQNEATLVIQGSLTFQTGGTYLYTFKATGNYSEADEVVANGVTISSGATLAVDAKTGVRLRVGTTFTAISNTAATPIAGTFSNLPDGSIITTKGNNFQASYEGGDGNDLTLTVVH